MKTGLDGWREAEADLAEAYRVAAEALRRCLPLRTEIKWKHGCAVRTGVIVRHFWPSADNSLDVKAETGRGTKVWVHASKITAAVLPAEEAP